jgi:cold shock CspA family protein
MFLFFHFSFFMKGTIKMKNQEKGFGFITPVAVEGQKAQDVFFHFSKVEGGDPVFKTLNLGDVVDFDVDANGQKGPQAANVRPMMDLDMAA